MWQVVMFLQLVSYKIEKSLTQFTSTIVKSEQDRSYVAIVWNIICSNNVAMLKLNMSLLLC